MPFPDICVEDKVNCPNEWPTLIFQQETCGEATVVLRTLNGSPLELDQNTNEVCLVTRQFYIQAGWDMNVKAEITGNPGEVRVMVNEFDTRMPGMFLGEFVVFQVADESTPEDSSSSGSDEPIAPPGAEESSSSGGAVEDTPLRKAIYRLRCFVEVGINLTNSRGTYQNGGITMAEIRLAIRDKCPEENFLLDCVEFTNTEIAWAIRRPLDLWNDLPPQMPRYRYSAATFPFRYYWLQGAAGELFQMAAYQYERNNLRYAAGNLTVDDKSQGRSYQEFSDKLRQEAYQWILRKKKELNMNQLYGTTNIAAFGNQSLIFDSGFNQ